MKKKRLIGTLLASSIAVTAAFTGCSLVSANNKADMRQVIATVNIANAENLSDTDKALIDNYKDAIGTTEIYKSELMAYYLNYGVSLVNQGYPYSTVFTTLVENLVENAVIAQYATMYLLNYKAATSSAATVLSEYNAKATYAEKLEYVLTDSNMEDPQKDIKIAKYNFYTTINTALDSYEQMLLDEDDKTSGSSSRATPSGVDTEQEDFYPANADGSLNYNVYTGYENYPLTGSGDYQKDALAGTTVTTRSQAYGNFLSTLIDNGLVDPEKDELLNVTDGISYMQDEYASRLENRVINKYYDVYEKEQEAKLTDEGAYDYLNKAYKKLVGMQEKSKDNFSSTFSNMSDTSFVLYSPDTEGEGTYGFVYNILLPFNAAQSARLSSLQNNTENKDEAGNYNYNYYKERNAILKQITTTDQRAAWFNGTTDYSFKAEDANFTAGTDYYAGANNDRAYLFFENNLTKTDRYEQLNKYIGKYAYNGKVVEMEEGGYQLVANTLTIDDMLAEFKAYVDFVLDGKGSVSFDNGYEPATGNEAYYSDFTSEKFYTEDTRENAKDKDKKIDYSNFIYASGIVNLNEVEVNSPEYRANLLNKDSTQYAALAAVNELQYAYTTDTGVLSQYIGYSVTLGDTTGYIKEFETAAHEAIANGAGAFNVCAGDYGWHLIFVTYTFDMVGEVYTPDWTHNVGVEGTFENFFYEWVKNNNIAEISTTRRTQIMTQFKTDSTVTKIESAYEDLLES